jgi:hypothetical protein
MSSRKLQASIESVSSIPAPNWMAPPFVSVPFASVSPETPY